MYTRCPYCTTIFRVTAAQLAAAHGHVQCGMCNRQFLALEDLLDQVPAPAPPQQPEPRDAELVSDYTPADPAASPPTTRTSDMPLARDSQDGARGVAASPAREDTGDGVGEIWQADAVSDRLKNEDWVIPAARARAIAAGGDGRDVPRVRRELDEPAEVRAPRIGLDDLILRDDPPIGALPIEFGEVTGVEETPSVGRWSRAFWTSGAAVLAALLLIQIIWFRHEALAAAIPTLQPALAWSCARLGCKSEAARDLAAVEIISRDVREHPRYQQTLLVNATIVNRATFRQPFPALQLSLYDNNGGLVARRRFAPALYLRPSIDLEQGMEPAQPVHVVLEITRVGDAAVSFEFEFL